MGGQIIADGRPTAGKAKRGVRRKTHFDDTHNGRPQSAEKSPGAPATHRQSSRVVTMDLLSIALDLVAAEVGIPREHLRPLERQIRQEQGGNRHYIASVAAMDCQERHAAIRAARASGLSAAEVAERMGVSRQHVYRVAG